MRFKIFADDKQVCEVEIPSSEAENAIIQKYGSPAGIGCVEFDMFQMDKLLHKEADSKAASMHAVGVVMRHFEKAGHEVRSIGEKPVDQMLNKGHNPKIKLSWRRPDFGSAI